MGKVLPLLFPYKSLIFLISCVVRKTPTLLRNKLKKCDESVLVNCGSNCAMNWSTKWKVSTPLAYICCLTLLKIWLGLFFQSIEVTILKLFIFKNGRRSQHIGVQLRRRRTDWSTAGFWNITRNVDRIMRRINQQTCKLHGS